MKNIRVFYLKNFQFLEMKFPIYLNRRVLVMINTDFKVNWSDKGDGHNSCMRTYKTSQPISI